MYQGSPLAAARGRRCVVAGYLDDDLRNESGDAAGHRGDRAPKTQHLGTYLDMLGAPHWLFGTLLRYLAKGGFPDIADMPEGERTFWGGSASFVLAAQDVTWDRLRDLRRQ